MVIKNAPFDRSKILNSIAEFHDVYSHRPIKNNDGGMKSHHMFATWYMAKTLQPKTIIESGVWKGLGTWILEQACPDARIISLDLNLSKREFISQKVEYHECDFSELDFRKIDTSDCLAFFDDHQDALNRLQQCHWLGIKDIIFEDNYNANEGDFYTLRMILNGSGFRSNSMNQPKSDYNSTTSKVLRKIKALCNQTGLITLPVIPSYQRSRICQDNSDSYVLANNLNAYYEFPPICGQFSLDTEKPLITDSNSELYKLFISDSIHYNNICYVSLK